MNGIQARLWNGRRFAPGWMTWKAGRIDRIGFDATPKTVGDRRNGQAVRSWPPVLPRVPLGGSSGSPAQA